MGYYHTEVQNGIIDRELDKAIKFFQSDQDLKIDGYMLPDGETVRELRTLLVNKENGSEDNMPALPPGKIEKEELSPPSFEPEFIPGTKIPNRGIPEEGYRKRSFDPFGNREIIGAPMLREKPINYSIDPKMEIFRFQKQVPKEKTPYR